MGGLFRLKRRHLPWIAIAIGLILALIGVLLRTAWAPEPLRTASVEPSEDVRLAVSDPGVLDLLSDDVTVTVDVVDAENLAEDNEDGEGEGGEDRKSTRLNSSHVAISYAVFCLKKKNER